MNVLDYFDTSTAAWLVESLGHTVWQGALAAGIAAVAAQAFRNHSAQARYWVYCTAMLLATACLPINLLLLAPSGENIKPVAMRSATVDSAAPRIVPISEAQADGVGESHEPDAPAIALEPATQSAVTIAEAGDRPFDWQRYSQWIALAYAVGMLAMALRLVAGLYGCQRLRSTAQPIDDSRLSQSLLRIGEKLCWRALPVVAYSARVTTPLVVGVVRPAILLPAAILNNLNPEQVESLLLHELAHIRRYDHWVNLIQRIMEAVLFFHPAVWWLSHKISVEREHCCDDLAIRWGSEPCDYAETLLQLAEIRYRRMGLSIANTATLAAHGRGASQLRERVLRVLGIRIPGPSVGLTRVGVAAMLAAALTSAVLLAAAPQGDKERDDLADFDFQNPPSAYEKGIEAADRDQSYVINGSHFHAGPMAWHEEGWLRLPREQQGPGQELFLNLGTSGGYDIVSFRLFDHATRKLVHDSEWQVSRDSKNSQDFFIERIGSTNWVRIKELAGTLPDKMDVWMRLVSEGKGEILVVDAKEGATASSQGSDIRVASLLAGVMHGKGGLNGQMTWDRSTADDQDARTTLALENRGQVFPGRFHVVAVSKDGSRHPMDDRHFREFSSTTRYVSVVLDVPLDEIDHLEVIPFRDRHKFFFNGLDVPARDPISAAEKAQEQAVSTDMPAEISGKIVLEDGSPADAKGWLYSDSTITTGTQSTNSTGATEGQFTESFRCAVPAGTVQLAYFADGYAPTWVGPFELKPGQQLDDVVISLTEGISAKLILSDEDGRAVPGATVVAHPHGDPVFASPVRELTTDDSGELLLEHLANRSHYKFTVTAPGYEPLRTAPMRVEQGESVRLTMVRSSPTEGVIRFADGTAAPFTKLRLLREWTEEGKAINPGSGGDGFWGRTLATTDAKGRFRLDQLADGSKYVFVIEAVDGVRAIVDNLEAGQQGWQLVLPQRKDLVIYVKGDLDKLPQRRGKAFASVRQPVDITEPDGSTYGELIGADVSLDAAEGGGWAIFRGLAVDLREDAPPQKVRVSLGYEYEDGSTSKTVELNQAGGTAVKFELPGGEGKKSPLADREHRLQVLTARRLTKTNDISTASNLVPERFVEWSPAPGQTEWLLLADRPPLFTDADVESARVKPNDNAGGGTNVAITLTEAAGERMRQATIELLREGADPTLRLVTVVDGKVLLAPRLMSVIGRNMELAGIRDGEEAEALREAIGATADSPEAAPSDDTQGDLGRLQGKWTLVGKKSRELGTQTVDMNPTRDTAVEFDLGGEETTSIPESHEAAESPVGTVRQWMKLALAGKDTDAAKLVKPDGPNQTDDLRETPGVEKIQPVRAYATHEAALVLTGPMQTKRGEKGVLAFRLHRGERRWLIDDIDFEDAAEADAQAEGFLGHPAAKSFDIASSDSPSESDRENSDAASAVSGQGFEDRRKADLSDALVGPLEMDGKPLAILAEGTNTEVSTDPPAHPLVAKLQGEWQAEMRSADGTNKLIAHVEDNQIRFCELNGENLTTFDFTIVSGTPHQKIDVKPKISALQRQAILAEIEFNPELAPLVLASDGFRGIIEASGDGFRMCLRGEPDGERPMLFTVNESQGLWVLNRPVDAEPEEDSDSVADQSQPANSLTVRLRDKAGNPIPNVRLRVYDGQRVWGGNGLAQYEMEFATTGEQGNATLPGIFDRIPEKAGYWIEFYRPEGAKWRAPDRLIGGRTGLTKVHAEDPLIDTRANADGLEITVTLREECPTDIEIVDAATGQRKHFAQLLFKDDRVDDWTVAALQDYVGDPGGDDPSRLALDFFTTMVPEMSRAKFMATHEGYYPVEFQLSEKLSPERTVRQPVELKPAPPIELTIVDTDGAPAVGAKLEYIGPDVRGGYRPLKPSDESGRITLPYPELGKLARYRVKHPSGEVDVDAKVWLEGEDDTPDAEAIEATVRIP